MKIKIFVMLLCLLATSGAFAKMPLYDDDAEFDNCTRMTGDWSRCMKEETNRDLNDIKIIYRDVLNNQNLNGWNSDIQENKQTLRDMYDSWIAYRNRFCSLSKVAAHYTGGWKDEELSCILYYTKHHKDHIRSIINMLNEKAVAEDNFIADEHDAEYQNCIDDGDKNKCLLSEFQRSSDKIKDLYKKLSESKYTAGWNNGGDLSNGNYCDMFESWIAYRNRLCSLAEYAYKKYPSAQQITKNHCLQHLNKEKLETLNNLYKLSQRAVNRTKAQKKAEDGGKIAGQAIKPLEKRVATTESLTANEEIKQKTETENTKKDENSSWLPSWARKK